MKYRYILHYTATNAVVSSTRTCFPLNGDDLSVSIDRESDERYYTRKLVGKLVFVGDDYDWMMAQPFDGSFELTIKESHDNGSNWYDYFTVTFSRASMEIDEDNHTATLNGIKEGVEDLIKNGKNEEYDLMKLIPDSYAKVMQGQVPPALALVDYRSDMIDKSDIFCGGPSVGNGYKDDKNDYEINKSARSNSRWYLANVCGEAYVQMVDGQSTEVEDYYCGFLTYQPRTMYGHTITGPDGVLIGRNGCRLYINTGVSSTNNISVFINLYDSNNTFVVSAVSNLGTNSTGYITPSSLIFTSFGQEPIESISINFHYIRATLLTYIPKITLTGVLTNVLDTGNYYKGMAAFDNGDSSLQVTITTNTSDYPTGHRIVPGSDDYGGIPQYFAPPDGSGWIPLAEDNWNYASMWYKITPTMANGLADGDNIGIFRWTRCWTIGCCIQHLLKRITDDRVVFAETPDYSQFLYGNPNPVEGHEPFQWLVTQKSNVMHPAATGASRCIVRLDWFFELLRNAFNCYYWFEKRNDGRYDFRIEHVEYFRRGGAYQGDLADQLDLTRLKPTRNFQRNGIAAKRYADQTNRYTFDLDGMVEKYTYSWQGEGGGDDFRGNPMYFKAGWIEKGSSEDRQVDNIFADLGWLMLNAGTATESSKNYSGLFIFGGYRADNSIEWKENTTPTDQYMTIAEGSHIVAFMDIWYTAPEGYTVTVDDGDTLHPYVGTGKPQVISFSVDELYIGGTHYIRIDFGNMYSSVVIHRIHARSGNVFYVPNVRNLLRTDVVNYLQNGVLAWPWLQKEYLHYDIPAAKWTYLKDDYTDNPNLVWETDGTIKMVKKQSVGVVPVPDASTEQDIMGIMGIKTGLGTGIIDSAKINLSSRDAEMTIIYDINPQNN